MLGFRPNNLCATFTSENHFCVLFKLTKFYFFENTRTKNIRLTTDRIKAIYSELNFTNNLTLSGRRVQAVLVFDKIISNGIFQLMEKKLSKATSIHLTANCE